MAGIFRYACQCGSRLSAATGLRSLDSGQMECGSHAAAFPKRSHASRAGRAWLAKSKAQAWLAHSTPLIRSENKPLRVLPCPAQNVSGRKCYLPDSSAQKAGASLSSPEVNRKASNVCMAFSAFWRMPLPTRSNEVVLCTRIRIKRSDAR